MGSNEVRASGFSGPNNKWSDAGRVGICSICFSVLTPSNQASACLQLQCNTMKRRSRVCVCVCGAGRKETNIQQCTLGRRCRSCGFTTLLTLWKSPTSKQTLFYFFQRALQRWPQPSSCCSAAMMNESTADYTHTPFSNNKPGRKGSTAPPADR